MLLKSISHVSFFILISRILGFVRDVLCAQIFGGSAAFDAFVVAYRIPNFLRRLLAEGAFSQALIPVFSAMIDPDNPNSVKVFIGDLAGTYGALLLIISVILFAAAPGIIFVFAPGFSDNPEQWQLASHLLRIMAVFVALISITAMFSALLNCYHHYVSAVACQLLMNAVMLTTLGYMLLCDQPRIDWLAYAVPIGAGLMTIQQTLHFHRVCGAFKPRFNLASAPLRRVGVLTSASLFSVSVAQIGLIIDNILASWLPTGSITWLYYGERLIGLPNGLIGSALSIVVLPYLAKFAANQEEGRFLAYQDWATRLLLVIALPATVGLWMLATPIIVTLFHYGVFSAHDATMTAAALQAFSLGLPSIMINRVLTTALLAEQHHKAVVRQSVIALVTNIALDIVLIWPLKHVGLAWALTLSSYLRSYLLIRLLAKHHPKILNPAPCWRLAKQAGFASTAMAAMIATYQAIHPLSWLTCMAGERALTLTGVMAAAIAVYTATLWLQGWRPRSMARPEG